MAATARTPARTTASLLQQYLLHYGARRFDWGSANCCHLAAGWVRVATGRDPMHGLAPTPDLHAALRLLRGMGGDLVAAWTQQLGCSALPATRARLGDVVLMPTPGGGTGAAVGICNGRVAAFTSEAGELVFHAMARCTHAWPLRGGA